MTEQKTITWSPTGLVLRNTLDEFVRDMIEAGKTIVSITPLRYDNHEFVMDISLALIIYHD